MWNDFELPNLGALNFLLHESLGAADGISDDRRTGKDIFHRSSQNEN